MAEPLTVQAKFLRSCEVPGAEINLEPFTIVIFGGSGDLAGRKLLPTLYHLFCEGRMAGGFTVIGVGLPELSDEAYRGFVETSLKKFSPENFESEKSSQFQKHVFYISGALDDDKVYMDLCPRLTGAMKAGREKEANIIFYLAIPPDLLILTVERLKKFNLCRGIRSSKVVVEKPFGKNLDSARKLNGLILQAFDENQIYRIDHYLGKDTVQNVLFFRFGNSIFEPLWNRNYIDHVQITVAEDIGIEHRGAFYEQAGVVRDIVQNHMMQLIALTAMEPPVGFEADLIRDEKVKVLRTIRQVEEGNLGGSVVFGQYGPGMINGEKVAGYRQENKVSPSSNQATYFCGKFYLDNWRWAGVPFYVRTGKRMKSRVSYIYIQFSRPPLKLFARDCDHIEPNALLFVIQPQEEISLILNVKHPGISNQPHTVQMGFNYEKSFQIKPHPAYERLLIDCVRSDLTLFSRQDEIEATWSVVDPVIKYQENKTQADFPNYDSGSWGPARADELMKNEGRAWWNPQN